jgi:hypothetical protein
VRALPTATLTIALLLATAPASEGAGRRGPNGFGNIPYGSPAEQALALNRGNGQLVRNNGSTVMAYTTDILGMTFQVIQNYDKDSKAVDAVATSTSQQVPTACIAQYNYVLRVLQSEYGKPATPPIDSDVSAAAGAHETKYVVLFEFDRHDGIEAGLTAPDSPAAAPAAGGGPAPGPCTLSLHYLPPGWVGHF